MAETWSSASTLATSASMTSRVPGSLIGVCEENTIAPDCPALALLKLSASTLNPDALSDAGISNLLENFAPTPTLPKAPMVTRATSHAITTVRRWRVQNTPRVRIMPDC